MLFLAPILILTIFTNERMGSYKVAKTFLYVVVLIGFLNAVLTIVQSLIDPLAALNISVAQDYSGHNFGDSYKVNGLFAIPNYSISISSISKDVNSILLIFDFDTITLLFYKLYFRWRCSSICT